MLIKSFNYTDPTWNLNTIHFNQLNLIVGKNAVGKSKTLTALAEVAKFIKGEVSGINDTYQCSLVFSDLDNKTIEYSFRVADRGVQSESMLIDGNQIISRNTLMSKLNEDIINPPSNKLIIQTQRDTNKFPEFEKIISWAEHLRGFTFSDLSAYHSFSIPNMLSESIKFDELYDKIDTEKEQYIISKMCELGYKINSVSKIPIEKFNLIYLKEDGVTSPLIPSFLSNGMLRVFYILTYMVYIATVEGTKTFMVDDLGEGLDYSRSSKLSKIMFDYCEEHGIQLIITSNDNFLLNSTNLNSWIILKRKSNNVLSYSYTTHPDMFNKFKRMGLNNFDILSTDFIYRYLENSSTL